MVNLSKSSKSKGPKDFEKVKAKVGKVKAGAVNATNTSFTAKRLNLKEQQLSTQQKASLFAQEASVRPDSLAALLKPSFTQTGHYNVNMRREAYGNILKTVKEHPDQVGAVLGMLVEQVSRGLIESEASVRSVVFAQSRWILESQREHLAAFFPSWVQFLLLGLTHLDSGIRKDAGKFLETAISTVPQLLVPHTAKILVTLADANSVQDKVFGRTGAKAKAAKPIDIALSLIDAYLAQVSKPKDVSSVLYEWQPRQKQSLRHCLIRGSSALTGGVNTSVSAHSSSPMTEADLGKISRWVGDCMIDDWLEAAPIIIDTGKAESQARQARSDPGSLERQAYNRVLGLLRRLKGLAMAGGFEDNLSYSHLPPKITQNGRFLSITLSL